MAFHNLPHDLQYIYVDHNSNGKIYHRCLYQATCDDDEELMISVIHLCALISALPYTIHLEYQFTGQGIAQPLCNREFSMCPQDLQRSESHPVAHREGLHAVRPWLCSMHWHGRSCTSTTNP